VKARGTVNDVALLEKDLAALDLRLFKGVKRSKPARGDAFIGQRPEPFTGLQFG
jgi:hypothetical protein